MDMVTSVKGLRKAYGSHQVLEDVSFAIPRGAIVGLIGDNGAGKSTLFKSLLGLVSCDKDELSILGVSSLEQHPEIKERIGVVFDAMNLPSALTITQLNKVFNRMYRQWDSERYWDLVKSFGLPLNKRVHTFSRGMSMKLSLAVALAHQAELLLLDEATGGLDPSSREQVLDELTHFSQKGGTVLLSSHIVGDVERVATHLMVIREGKVALYEERGDISANYGVATVTEEERNSLPSGDVVCAHPHNGQLRVLVSDRNGLPSSIQAEAPSLEELSVMLTRREHS